MKIQVKIISVILVICMMLPVIPVSAEEAWTLDDMMSYFPHGKYWNHQARSGHGYNSSAEHIGNNCGDVTMSVTNQACHSGHNGKTASVGQYDCNVYRGKQQCKGFAYLMADLSEPGYTNIEHESWQRVYDKNTAVSVVKPGDVLHYFGDGTDSYWGHWVFVIGVSGSWITVGECNWPGSCVISWGRSINIYNMKSIELYRSPFVWDYSSSYSLDVNAYLDGEEKLVLDDIATVDVYINDSLVADDVSDYFTNHKKGSTYKVTDVKPKGCYVLTGVSSFSGTLNEATYLHFEFETRHALDDGIITKPPTCTEKGEKTFFCMNCDYSETVEMDARGHDYEETRIPPTCTSNAKYIGICSMCDDTVVRVVEDEDVWSAWSEEVPAEGLLTESKTQYRTMQYETTVSTENELDGWTFVGNNWSEGVQTTVQYIASFPDGFDRNNALYKQYNISAPVAFENDTTKVEVGTATTAGYVYWHWCSSSYNGSSPINRLVNHYYTAWEAADNRAYDIFHAFYSTEYRAASASSGVVNFSNSWACNQTYWWFGPLSVISVPVTTYEMLNEFERETGWSEWSDSAPSDDSVKYETRTVYRYSDSADLAQHSWNDGVTVDNITTYTCTICGETKICTADTPEEPDVPDIPVVSDSNFSLVIPSEITVGEKFETVLHCKDMSGTEDGDLTFTFDSDLLALENIEVSENAGFYMANADKADNDKAKLSFFYLDTPPAECDLIVFTFKALKEGTANVSVVIETWNGGENPGDAEFNVTIKTAVEPENPPVHSHSYTTQTITEPTCTTQGYTTYICACGDSYTGNEVNAKGHSYTAKVTAPTCTSEGYTVHTCTRCKDTYTDSKVNALGHSYKNTVTAPTCTSEGYTVHTCTRCNDTYTDSKVNALGHSYKNTVTAPTCTSEGYTVHTCTRCKDTYTDSKVNALGHSYKNTVTAPTCTSEGYTTHTCSRCQNTYTDTKVNATGHKWGEWKEVSAPTFTANGKEERSCSFCKKTESRTTDKLSYRVGDVDKNGSITAADARLALRASVGLENLSDSQKKAADADGNGTITAADARLILRASVGLEKLDAFIKD